MGSEMCIRDSGYFWGLPALQCRRLHNGDPQARVRAGRWLSRYPSDRSRRALQAQIARERDPFVLCILVRDLGQICDQRSIPLLQRLADTTMATAEQAFTEEWERALVGMIRRGHQPLLPTSVPPGPAQGRHPDLAGCRALGGSPP